MTTSNDQGGWAAVVDAVRARMAQLSITQTELSQMSGVSRATFTPFLLHGKPILRADKRRGLAEALGWKPDAVDRILAGKKPLAAPAAPANLPPESAELVSSLASRMDELEQLVTRLLEAHPLEGPAPQRSA